jgi:hypothetical protein
MALLKKLRCIARIAFVLIASAIPGIAQDQLSLDDIPAESVPLKEAFNGPQLIYCQSTNMLEQKRFDVVFGHRFGKVNEGAFNAFGLDQAFIRIGFEYGIKDWLTAGIGRSSLGKNFDLYAKYRPVVQTKGGSQNIPVSVIIFGSSAFSANELRRQNEIHMDDQLVNQLVYTLQASVSRQFSTRFSAQLTGSFVHRNSVPLNVYDNDMYSAGGGIRFKLSNRIHFLTEYHYLTDRPEGIENPFAAGIDIVAGGHVFNLHFANSAGIIEKEFLAATTDAVADGGLRFGFTVRRSFMKSKVEGGKTKY